MSASPANLCTIRRFEAGDVEAVAEIEARVSAEPWSQALFAGEFDLAEEVRHWIVAELDHQIVGFGGLMFVADEGHLMNVAVHPDYQRRGIARRICADLFSEAQRRGTASLTLEVRVSNDAALALYREFGFQPVGSRKDYYSVAGGGREDALILWLHDVESVSFEVKP